MNVGVVELLVLASRFKTTYIKDPPIVLCVHLKRFSNTAKITTQIEVPQVLDINPYSPNYSASSKPQKYVFRASIKHIGPSAAEGHYKTLTKSKGYFLEYNDASVTSPLLTQQDVSKDSYVLFFEKESDPKTPKPLQQKVHDTSQPVVSPASKLPLQPKPSLVSSECFEFLSLAGLVS